MAASSCSPASIPTPSPSNSHPPSCARRACASPPNGAADLAAITRLIEAGQLSLDGLITHRRDATEAPDAYRTAFTDPTCLKMILDWRTCQ
jgi:hypothetical protein